MKNKKRIITIALATLLTVVVAFFAIAFYGMSITPKYDYTSGAQVVEQVSESKEVTGKIVKFKVKSVDAGSTGIFGYMPEDTDKIVFIPKDQQHLAKVGDTVYFKLKDSNMVLGYAFASGEEVK